MKKEIIEERRTRFLENLLQEAIVNILAEQAAPEPPATPAAPPPATPAAPPPATTAPETQEETNVEDENTEFTIEEMIERLNVIRGGKSFKDNDVYTKLVVLFSKLSDQQKNDLRQMLIAIGQAVINVPEDNSEQQPVETSTAVPETASALPAA